MDVGRLSETIIGPAEVAVDSGLVDQKREDRDVRRRPKEKESVSKRYQCCSSLQCKKEARAAEKWTVLIITLINSEGCAHEEGTIGKQLPKQVSFEGTGRREGLRSIIWWTSRGKCGL